MLQTAYLSVAVPLAQTFLRAEYP